MDIVKGIDFYVAKTAIALCLLVALFGVVIFKSGNKSIKSLTCLLVSHFIFQVFAYQVYLLMGENVQYYKFAKFLYVIFEYFFFLYLMTNQNYRRLISIIFSSGTIVLCAHYMDSFSSQNNQSISIILNNTMVLLACLVYFIFMMKKISLHPLLRQWRFIIVTGFIVYALGSTGSHIMLFYAFEVGLQSQRMTLINALIYILELCIFFWGLWVYRAELKNNQKLKAENRKVE